MIEQDPAKKSDIFNRALCALRVDYPVGYQPFLHWLRGQSLKNVSVHLGLNYRQAQYRVFKARSIVRDYLKNNNLQVEALEGEVEKLSRKEVEKIDEEFPFRN